MNNVAEQEAVLQCYGSLINQTMMNHHHGPFTTTGAYCDWSGGCLHECLAAV